MQKFFVMTRGRTGSSAIIDEFDKVSSIIAKQELFLHYENERRLKQYQDYVELFAQQCSFEAWKQWKTEQWSHDRSLETHFLLRFASEEQLKEAYLNDIVPSLRDDTPITDGAIDSAFEVWRLKKLELWRKKRSLFARLRRLSTKKRLARIYLDYVEGTVARKGARAFGFKVLSHHFDQVPYLKGMLTSRGYNALYLTRNIPRQVISGLVARQRGLYNTNKEYKDERRYNVDVEEFEDRVKWEELGVKNDLLLLRKAGFPFIEISYEEFMTDRRRFFERTLGFIGVPPELPQASSYAILIKDLEYSVENFEEVAQRAARIGMKIE
jgi:hypothetical protein